MERRGLVQPIGHADGHRVALAPAQRGAGQHAVDGRGDGLVAREVNHGVLDDQIELGAAQHRRGAATGAGRPGGRLRPCRHGANRPQHAACRQALNESTP
ncbi:hypothetical protein D3C72_1775810 [compost metagenome]